MHPPPSHLLAIALPVVVLATAWLRHVRPAGDAATRRAGAAQPNEIAKRLDASDGGTPSLLEFELVPAWTLRVGDLLACWTGDVVTAGAVVIAGSAVVTSGARPCVPRRVKVAGARIAAGTRILEGYLLLRLEEAPGGAGAGAADGDEGLSISPRTTQRTQALLKGLEER
jgi:high-affinity K+ transport system ATPase subunit B